MRVARYVLLFVFLMVSGSSAWAQFSVPTTTERFDSKDLPYAIRPKSGGRMPEYFSLDRQKAIRRAIRLNRNTLEVNTLPGMTPNSIIPREAAVAGISYPLLCERIVELSLQRCAEAQAWKN